MMSGREDDRIVALQLNASTAADQKNDDLPFAVELWDAEAGKVERVIARAASGQLARAIFSTAQNEFPERRITLRRGSETILDSTK